jgi:uncharacterized protein (DUF305 family)
VKRFRTPWAFAALIAALTSSACSRATAPTGGPPAPTPPTVATTPTPTPTAAPSATARRANPADVEFMTGMIHHHAQALVMAGWVESHGENTSLRVLAERISVSQTDEIKLIQQWLREQGEVAPEASPDGMRMQMGGVEHVMLMPGMLNEEQMAELNAARGARFDRLFLAYMIYHHEGALKMVEALFASFGGGMDDTIYKFASDTFADQGSEIDRMSRMLEAMGGLSP